MVKVPKIVGVLRVLKGLKSSKLNLTLEMKCFKFIQ